ncbi:MAG: pyridoxal phosphate-dependent aminotransferase [Candidatus Thermoplasmatota archaeon]|nr:pyridoxal phosphate-dependent aminotransferase [Candidatus Thermoplasmatota archaeon]
MFSKRIRDVQPSGTVMLANKVKQMKNQGIDVISFTLGEPDFPTPEHIIDAAKQALDDGMTHYVQSTGIPPLREAVAAHVTNKNGIKAASDNILILPTKFALYGTIQALVDPGDEVIHPDPGWVSYGPMIELAGGVPVPVRMRYKDSWVWEPEDIASKVTDRTKAIILNTPSNPTGSIISADTLKAIGDIAEDHDLRIISDEIYENLVYEDTHFSIGSIERIRDRVITISGFSKSYAMTGWRVGWMVADKETVKMVNKLQQHSLTCLPAFVQMGALAALREGDECVRTMKEEFRARRNMVIPMLNEIDGVSCEMPRGAFYAFFRTDLGIPSMELADMLLQKAHVSLTPGSAFGTAGESYMRMSYAASRDELTEGIGRIARFISSLKG